jgi:hypothetical protein
MAIEAGTTISQLNKLWPTGTDKILEGDNHLRLIKSILKTQFPGAGGNGFAIPITAKEVEINHLSGVTSNVQAQINAINANVNLIAPSGTVLVFFQASPPVGWTQLPGNNDSMLRVVSTAGGGNGGSNSPISFNTSHTHTTGSHALSVAEIPPHVHGVPLGVSVSASYNTSNSSQRINTANVDTTPTGGGQAHNHGNTGSSGVTWTPKYINVITAVKS